MFTRLLAQRAFLKQASYTLVDEQPDNIAYARTYISNQAKSFNWEQAGGRFTSNEVVVELKLIPTDLASFSKSAAQQFDIVIANAFLDLLPLKPAVSTLFSLLKPGGLFYFSINFDGLTLFEPPINPQLDVEIAEAYHQTMDNRRFEGQSTGGRSAGRQLFSVLNALGANIMSMGSSDWVIHPINQRYPSDEAYFLHFIVQTVYRALRTTDTIKPNDLEHWAEARHQQIEKGELLYIAHQLDYIGRIPSEEG